MAVKAHQKLIRRKLFSDFWRRAKLWLKFTLRHRLTLAYWCTSSRSMIDFSKVKPFKKKVILRLLKEYLYASDQYQPDAIQNSKLKCCMLNFDVSKLLQYDGHLAKWYPVQLNRSLFIQSLSLFSPFLSCSFLFLDFVIAHTKPVKVFWSINYIYIFG
jgi:hypothetical protein